MQKVKKLFVAAFMALGLATFVGAPAMLTGCAGLGLVKPQGFEEVQAAGYQSVEVGAKLVGTLLDAGKLSAQDARNAHTQLTNLREGLDLAAELRLTNAPAGEARQRAALAGIDALLVYLRSKQ